MSLEVSYQTTLGAGGSLMWAAASNGNLTAPDSGARWWIAADSTPESNRSVVTFTGASVNTPDVMPMTVVTGATVQTTYSLSVPAGATQYLLTFLSQNHHEMQALDVVRGLDMEDGRFFEQLSQYSTDIVNWRFHERRCRDGATDPFDLSLGRPYGWTYDPMTNGWLAPSVSNMTFLINDQPLVFPPEGLRCDADGNGFSYTPMTDFPNVGRITKSVYSPQGNYLLREAYHFENVTTNQVLQFVFNFVPGTRYVCDWTCSWNSPDDEFFAPAFWFLDNRNPTDETGLFVRDFSQNGPQPSDYWIVLTYIGAKSATNDRDEYSRSTIYGDFWNGLDFSTDETVLSSGPYYLEPCTPQNRTYFYWGYIHDRKWMWDFDAPMWDSGSGYLDDGTNDAFDGCQYIYMDTPAPTPVKREETETDTEKRGGGWLSNIHLPILTCVDDETFILGPGDAMANDGSEVVVNRKFYTPKRSNFNRELLSFFNPNNHTVEFTLVYAGNLGSDGGTIYDGGSSDGGAPNVTDRYWISSDGDDGLGDPPVSMNAYAAQGSQVVSALTATLYNDNYFIKYNMSVPAGATRSLLFFVSMNLNTAAARSMTHLIDSSPSWAFRGLTPQEISTIVNWDLEFTLPTTGTTGTTGTTSTGTTGTTGTSASTGTTDVGTTGSVTTTGSMTTTGSATTAPGSSTTAEPSSDSSLMSFSFVLTLLCVMIERFLL